MILPLVVGVKENALGGAFNFLSNWISSLVPQKGHIWGHYLQLINSLISQRKKFSKE